MTTEEVLKILEARGLTLEWDGAGPRVKGALTELTPALQKVLKRHRVALIERVKPKPRREWLWAGGRHHMVDDGFPPEPWQPAGAWYWRYEGEPTWRAVPGRPGETTPLPDGA